MRLEIAVHQNQRPRSRPETFDWNPGQNAVYPVQDLQSGRRDYIVSLSGVVPITERWWSLMVELRVTGPKLCEPRPGVVFGRPADVPTVVYFPSVAPEENEMFGGWFTVSLRVTA